MHWRRHAVVVLVFCGLLWVSSLSRVMKAWGTGLVIYLVGLWVLYVERIEPQVRGYFERKWRTKLRLDIGYAHLSWWAVGDPSVNTNNYWLLATLPTGLLLIVIGLGSLVLAGLSVVYLQHMPGDF